MMFRSPVWSHARARFTIGAWISLVLTFLVASWSPLAGAAQRETELEIWSDPQLRLPIPAGWHRLEATWIAERILIATPEPLGAEELFGADEVDVPAIVHAKIDALDPVLAQVPLDAIADALVDQLASQSEETGSAFDVLRREATSVGEYEAYRFGTRRGDTSHHSLFIRTKGHLYEVTVAFEVDRSQEYEGLVEAIFSGVEPQPVVAETTPMEERETPLARLFAPQGWEPRTIEGSLPQVVLTKDDVDLLGGRYRTGISLLKVAQYRQAFDLPDAATVADLYDVWLQRYAASMAAMPHRLLQAVEIMIDAGPSLLIEASFEDPVLGHHAQLFNVVTAVGDDFYIATFEAPVDEFFLLRPVFLESIASLRWR